MGIENKHGTGHLVKIRVWHNFWVAWHRASFIRKPAPVLWPRGHVWHHTLQGSVEKSVTHLSFPGRCSWLWSCWRRGLRLGQWCLHFPASPPYPYICPTLGRWNGQEETPHKAILLLARGQLRGVVGVLETRSVQGERERKNTYLEGEESSSQTVLIPTGHFSSPVWVDLPHGFWVNGF